MFRLSSSPINSEALRRELADFRAGGFVSFEGRVRSRNEGRQVRGLEYEVYGELAEKEGARIVDEARRKFAVRAAACVHRVGRLRIGAIAVWAGAAAEHRDAAFAACRYIIDEVKARVPIWKKEHYATGSSRWIHPGSGGGAKPVLGEKGKSYTGSQSARVRRRGH
jgi:molybdopterin synthase catalytic subunit